MGLNSELIAIGDYKLIEELNLLDPDSGYHNPEPNSLVVTTVALCNTNEASRRLANLCGKDLRNYNDDLVVTCVEPEDCDEMFGDDPVMDIYRLVKYMLNRPQQVELYLRV